MTDETPLKRKVSAFILRKVPNSQDELLVHSVIADPFQHLRVPGGGIYEGEEPEQALFREIREETGLVTPRLLRKMGVDSYHKTTAGANIERHNYLLRVPSTMPDTWEHRITGKGNDAGKVFLYEWIGVADLDQVDEEYGVYITPENIPEMFEAD